MQPNQPQSTWTVQSQNETMEAGANNVLTRGVRVQFVTGNAQKGSVFVPQEVYVNTDRVRDMIQQAANQMDAISGLSN